MCSNMVGVEYILLHVQDPILYVVRKSGLRTVSKMPDFKEQWNIRD